MNMESANDFPVGTTITDLWIDEPRHILINRVNPMAAELTTRKSLLSRLRKANDDRDWQSFYDQYRGVIISFCRKEGLDGFSAQDVLQETVILLMRKLPEFQYDPARGKFRNWLLKLVAGKVRDAHKRAHRARLVSIEEVFDDMTEPCSGVGEVSETLENSWRQALIEEALRRIKADPRTQPRTFEVFQSYVLNGASVADVAQAFQMEENAVYQIKNRMLQRLEAEVTALEENARPIAALYGK